MPSDAAVPPLDSVFGHEQVVFCHDEATGLRAVVAIATTALGPALGGTRFHPYPDVGSALNDALRLSRAMALKNAAAGLAHGGGKAVIIGDPTTDKSDALLRAYGRFVQSLGGRYVTACDVGTYVADMDVVGQETRFATGRSTELGGAGDSSVLTAYGVFVAMQAAAGHVWGTPSLAGRRVGVEGVGKVGRQLVGHLLQDGADVVVTDVSQPALRALVGGHPQVSVVGSHDELVGERLDVLAPCALGGGIDDRTADLLDARVVCGAANNQLADESVRGGTADRLAARGILYAPDFLVNSGGVIQVSDELHGFDFERAKARTAGIADTVTAVLRAAEDASVTPLAAAVRLAEERIAGAGGGRRPWLPEPSPS